MCLVLDQFLWGHSSRVCDISCFSCFFFSQKRAFFHFFSLDKSPTGNVSEITSGIPVEVSGKIWWYSTVVKWWILVVNSGNSPMISIVITVVIPPNFTADFHWYTTDIPLVYHWKPLVIPQIFHSQV